MKSSSESFLVCIKVLVESVVCCYYTLKIFENIPLVYEKKTF